MDRIVKMLSVDLFQLVVTLMDKAQVFQGFYHYVRGRVRTKKVIYGFKTPDNTTVARSTAQIRPKLGFARIRGERGYEGLGLGHVQCVRLVYETSKKVEDADGFHPIKDVVLHCEVRFLI